MSLALDPAAQDLLFREAHTANTFTDEPVTDEQVRGDLRPGQVRPHRLQPVARCASCWSAPPRPASACVQHMAEGNRPKTADRPADRDPRRDNEFHEELPELFPHVPAGQGRRSSPSAATREKAGSLNAALQAGYFIVGVRAAGLAAGPMTGFDCDGVHKEFLGDGTQPADGRQHRQARRGRRTGRARRAWAPRRSSPRSDGIRRRRRRGRTDTRHPAQRTAGLSPVGRARRSAPAPPSRRRSAPPPSSSS